MSREYRFEVPGPDGQPVPYFGHTFDYPEGFDLAAELMEVAGTAISGGSLGGSVAALSKAVMAKGGSVLVGRLLARTARDGVKLDTPAALTEAYTDNYGEVVVALSHVIRENFGDFFGERVREGLATYVQKYVGALARTAPDGSWPMPTSADSTSGSSPNASG